MWISARRGDGSGSRGSRGQVGVIGAKSNSKARWFENGYLEWLFGRGNRVGSRSRGPLSAGTDCLNLRSLPRTFSSKLVGQQGVFIEKRWLGRERIV